MPPQKPIERTFPINQVNRIAEREASIAKKYYRPIYTMHKWWAPRCGSVFRTIAIYSLFDEKELKRAEETIDKGLFHFEKDETERLWNLYLQDVQVDGDVVVLDPMMGGGTSIVEALRLGCKVVGCDINPVAWFVVKKEIEPVDLDELGAAFERLKETVAPEILKYYKTTCPRCGQQADVMYYFWVKELPCVNCGQTVPFFKDYRVATSRSMAVEHHRNVVCAKCGNLFTPTEANPRCPECGWEFDHSGFYHLICPRCGRMFEQKGYRGETKCPHCGLVFDPSKGTASGQYYTCPACSQKYRIIDAIEQFGKPPERLYGVEYYCPHCDLKGYKAADGGDLALYEKARVKFEAKKDQLPIPEQKVPMGYNTKQMINYGYHYFRDMFNARQLLCLGKLLRAVTRIEDSNVRELMLLAFSETLKFNNTFCRYNRSKNQLSDIFRGHEYHPQDHPLESNLWGEHYGMGFGRVFKKVKVGKKYCNSPFEKYVNDNGVTQEQSLSARIEADLVSKFEELGNEGNALLLCRSSDFLPLPDQCADLVLTDPPYYDNVMYSELSDFFYVWLRMALKDEYPQFRAELTPKTKEVIKNEAQGKGEEEFLAGLRAVFKECHRVLKDKGLMAFTYHHKKDEAWSAVLEAVLKAGFYITASWPIHSEMSTSTHIYDKKNISYDTIIVARKREGEGERISWRNLEDQIYERAEEIVRYYAHENGRFVSEPDMGVIAQGKCLELYSKHYPNVMEGGEPVSVKKAVKRTTNIVTEQLIEDRFQTLATQTDTLSALYLMFLADRDTISYNALSKWLRGRGADVEDFTNRDLLRHDGDILRVTETIARRAYIEGASKPLAVDGAHYLYYAFKEGDLQAEARRWANPRTIAAAKELHKITRDQAYEKIAKYLQRVRP